MIVTTYSIRCDGCEAYYDCDSESIGYLEKRAKAKGWTTEETSVVLSMDLNGNRMVGKSYTHYCSKCKEKQNEKID